MRWRFFVKSLLPFLAMVAAGCGDHAVPEVEMLDEQGFQQLIQERQGKILVVNVWATWCAPCREEFPALVKLAEAYRNSEVEIIGISVDYPDEIASKILPFLEKQNANFKNYVRNFADDQAFIQSINPKWSGALPVTALYDRQGNQQVFHVGEADFETFRQYIESLR